MTNPTLISTPFAADGDKSIINDNGGEAPNSATWEKGFPPVTQTPITAGGIPPKRTDFNGVLNAISGNIVHQTKGLGYEFDAAYAAKIGGYPLSARLTLSNGDIVRSTVDGNVTDPNVDMTGWFNFENFTKTYIDNFPYYLKFDSSIDDYSPIIQNLIESGVRIQLTTDAIYPCRTPIDINSLSKPLYIDGHGALLSYLGGYTNRFITIRHSIPLNHVINSFYLNGNRNTSSCFYLESSQNNIDGESDFFASQFGASNCFKQTSNESGSIVEILGAFKSVKFISPKIENIELGVGAGVSQIQGVTGLTVRHLNSNSYTRILELQSPQITKVFSEDIDYTDDQDGVRFFTGASSKFNRKNKSKFLCYGGVFSKCWGRSVKTQCGYTLISGGSFERDEGNSTKLGNNEISVQHGNGSVSGASFYYSNGYASTCVSFDTGANYNCSGGSVRDCEVFLDDETTLPAFISNQPRDDGGSQTIIADGNKVHGKAELFSRFRVSGLNNEFIVNNNMVEEIVAVDHFGTGLSRVFNVALGIGVSPRSGLLTMNHNSVIYSDNDVALSLDNISGQAINLPVSSQGNFGFNQNPRGNADRGGLKVKQVNKADGYGRANYRTYTTTLSQSLTSGTTYDFQSEGSDGGMIFIGLSGLNLSQCIISVSAGSIRVLQSHNTEDSLQVYFNNNQPSTPQGLLLDIWRHPDQNGKIVIRNNSSSTRVLNIFQIVM